MIENLVAQISHQGYKINPDPITKNVWKITLPGDDLKIYSLDNLNGKVSLYENNRLICQLNENDDLFEILRHLPPLQHIGNNINIEDLFNFCNANSFNQKQKIISILNFKNINMFRDRRDFAYYIAECLKDAGFGQNNRNYDLSLIDILMNII